MLRRKNKEILQRGGVTAHVCGAKKFLARVKTRSALHRKFCRSPVEFFFTGRCILTGCEQRNRSKTSESVASDSRQCSDQSPSFFLSRSLTACGLALPPDDFI